jgi:hypothetical protein
MAAPPWVHTHEIIVSTPPMVDRASNQIEITDVSGFLMCSAESENHALN